MYYTDLKQKFTLLCLIGNSVESYQYTHVKQVLWTKKEF